jgi:hypothetical protein
VPSNTRGPRGRSRKPRPGGSLAGERAHTEAHSEPGKTQADPRKQKQRSSRRDRARSGRTTRGPVPVTTTYGERPPAPWHPLPLSELLILVGGVAFVIALIRLGHGVSAGGPLLLASIVAVALGTIEVAWREHRSGFRSHTMLLALMPVVVLHSAVVLGYTFLSKASQVVNLGMFAVDIVVFVVLFRLLRTRFLDARARAATRSPGR